MECDLTARAAGWHQIRNRELEDRAAAAIRWRRIQNSEPCAAYVLDQWRQRRRIAKGIPLP